MLHGLDSDFLEIEHEWYIVTECELNPKDEAEGLNPVGERPQVSMNGCDVRSCQGMANVGGL